MKGFEFKIKKSNLRHTSFNITMDEKQNLKKQNKKRTGRFKEEKPPWMHGSVCV